MAIYMPKYFKLQELVDSETFNELGQSAWLLFDVDALISLDALREKFGPCLVNNWHSGGNFSWRGFRSSKCTVGAQKSQHRLGKAFDCSFNTPAKKIREYLLLNRKEFPLITAIEDDVTWLHFDVRHHGGTGIKVFKP